MSIRSFFPSTVRDAATPSIYDSAAYIFSPRLLNPSYTGQCARIVRSGDAAQLDIPFSGGLMVEADIISHCGANDGYIRYYNQGSKVGNEPAEFAQKIYDGATGQILKVNGKPAGYFNLNISGFGASYSWNIGSDLADFIMDKPSMVFSLFQSDYSSTERRGIFGEQRGGTQNIGLMYDTRSNRHSVIYRPDATQRTMVYDSVPSNEVFHSLGYSNSDTGVINCYLDGTKQASELTAMDSVIFATTLSTSSLQWGLGFTNTNTSFLAIGYSPEYVSFDYYDSALLASIIAEQIAYYGI